MITIFMTRRSINGRADVCVCTEFVMEFMLTPFLVNNNNNHKGKETRRREYVIYDMGLFALDQLVQLSQPATHFPLHFKCDAYLLKQNILN